MARLSARWSALALCLVLAAFTQHAAAQDISPAQVEQFAKAQRMYDAKDYAGALPLFEELLRQTNSPNARFYVARALRDLGRVTEAYDQMTLTVRESGARAATEPKYEQTRDAAAAELAQLQDKVGHVVIALVDPPAGVTATLDDKPLAAAQLGSSITVMPGAHRIEVSSAGLETVRRELEVKGGETKTEAIALKKAASGDGAPPSVPAPTSGGELRIVGIVAAGLGVASLATFGATFALANERFATLEDECGAARCREASYGDVIDEGKTFELVSTVTAVVGAVLVAGSIPLIILGGPSETSTSAALAPLPGGAMASVRGTF